jgi:hypothetical protein
MTINKNTIAQATASAKSVSLEKQFLTNTLGVEDAPKVNSPKEIKDLSLLGGYYSNGIQMEDYAANPGATQTQKFSLLPIYGDMFELDESYSSFKAINSLFSKTATPVLASVTNSTATRSYISVFNFFRSDFEDFA